MRNRKNCLAVLLMTTIVVMGCGNQQVEKENPSAVYERASSVQDESEDGEKEFLATVYKGNIIKNLIMDCQSYTKYRPNETTGGIFVSWRRKEELPTGA